MMVGLVLLIGQVSGQRGRGSFSSSSNLGNNYNNNGSGTTSTSQTNQILVSIVVVVAFVSLIGCLIYFVCCGLFRRRAVRKKYLERKRENMVPEQQFDGMANDFRQLIYGVCNHENRFCYQDEGYDRDVEMSPVQMDKVEPWNYEVVLKGSDYFGTWVGEGNYFMTSGGPFLWFIKAYDDYRRSGQTCEEGNLIYESESMGPRSFYGRWFYEGQENSRDYSGKWRVESRLQQGPAPMNTFG